ncbi:putative membrane protein [Desulfonispora thiosulfatigenes DSM 11270]|uniref:Putative membrane protein n=1 Tax=Desulfonispora thiosulfatigenes DSM 11270 TaxID=656914 RepID=A0A1W1UWV7_DESTI|nr:phage holin family protein [Desulfonispora thiosulfatigenes]SMB85516.1 putative membrane protein [Desulfonispora thiosulfatigenes DSM 11270]
MKGWILRWLLSGLSLILTAAVVSGIEVKTFFAALFAALVLGMVNAIIRPIILVLTLPINIFSLGLFTLIINGFMLKITSGVVNGFEVNGFWAATFGAILLSIISGILNAIVKD